MTFDADSDWIRVAYLTLAPLLGTFLASVLFAVALLASGQSSTITGTLAGQVVMEGFMRWRIAPWKRRLVTRLLAIVPAVLFIALRGAESVTGLLVLSQVVLAMQLPLAMFPLMHLTSSKKIMGRFANGPVLLACGWTAVLLITALDLYGLPEALNAAWRVRERLTFPPTPEVPTRTPGDRAAPTLDKVSESFPRQQRPEPVEVLLVGRLADGTQLRGQLGRLEFLNPIQVRTAAAGRERNRERKQRRDDVVDHDFATGLNLAEDALVGVVRPVRPVHHEHPPPARLELEPLERVREPLRPPPTSRAIPPARRRRTPPAGPPRSSARCEGPRSRC